MGEESEGGRRVSEESFVYRLPSLLKGIKVLQCVMVCNLCKKQK